MKLVLIHGAPGVGKLTVGRELGRLTGFPLFHNHLVIDLLAHVFPSNSPSYLRLREQLWLAVIGAAAHDRLAGLIFTFVYESSTLPGFFDRLIETLGPENRLYPVELRCDLAENERRLEQPDRREFLKVTTNQFLREWVLGGRYMSPSGLPNNLLIETTDLSAADTAMLIASHLQES